MKGCSKYFQSPCIVNVKANGESDVVRRLLPIISTLCWVTLGQYLSWCSRRATRGLISCYRSLLIGGQRGVQDRSYAVQGGTGRSQKGHVRSSAYKTHGEAQCRNSTVYPSDLAQPCRIQRCLIPPTTRHRLTKAWYVRNGRQRLMSLSIHS